MSNIARSYSLYELVASVRRCIEATYVERYWVRAETSGLSVNTRSGHCYLELEERDERHGCRARIKANIWRDSYLHISKKLESEGLPQLSSGMSILCQVQVKYHEQYGISLLILDIDPSYNLGEIARLRQETIARLQREGVWADNKGLSLPSPLQRLAIVSSPTAAGYGDFMNQLHGNSYGLRFYTALFTAQMQGEKTGDSVIAALDRIASHLDQFDAVLIIRGGGAESELRAFDDYKLSYYCTQFPLPIISGIGHDRDVSILDMVSHTSLKTPTAVAEFLIQYNLAIWQALSEQKQRLASACNLIQSERQRLFAELSLRLPHLAAQRLKREGDKQSYLREQISFIAKRNLNNNLARIEQHSGLLPYLVRNYLHTQKQTLAQSSQRLSPPIKSHLLRHEQQVERYEQAIRLADPELTLRRGFALVQYKGKIASINHQFNPGDKISIRLGQQEIHSVVEHSTSIEG